MVRPDQSMEEKHRVAVGLSIFTNLELPAAAHEDVVMIGRLRVDSMLWRIHGWPLTWYAGSVEIVASSVGGSKRWPSTPGEVQQAFNIQPEGRFVIAVKNPSATSPPGVGLEFDRQADFPLDLKARFGDRRWMSVDPAAFLDHEGAEIVLIGGPDDLGEDLGMDLQTIPTNEETADLFRELHVERSERTIKPRSYSLNRRREDSS